MAPVTVAIAGGTGYLGVWLAKGLLSPSFYPSQIGRVIILTRNPQSATAQSLKALGAELSDAPVSEALKGADVLVNSLAETTSAEEKNHYAKAAAEAGVKVYFPTEFGYDHYNTGVQHRNWQSKEEHEEYARQLNGGSLKVIALYTMLFMDLWQSSYALGIGFDKKNRTITIPVSADNKTSYVHPADIGRAVARLSIMATESPSSVPDRVRIQGSAKSVRGVADLISRATGKEIQITVTSGEEYRKKLTVDNYVAFLQWLIGVGFDVSDKNDDELVNPSQSLWKWTTFEEYIEENKESLL